MLLAWAADRRRQQPRILKRGPEVPDRDALRDNPRPCRAPDGAGGLFRRALHASKGRTMVKLGLLDRLADGPVICAEGYLFELERRGYLQAGAYVPRSRCRFPRASREPASRFPARRIRRH